MRIKKGFVLREMCGEYIVAGEGIEHVNFNKLLNLNRSAAYLWQQIKDRDFTEEHLTQLLLRRYEVTPEQASADVRELCRTWREAGIIE